MTPTGKPYWVTAPPSAPLERRQGTDHAKLPHPRNSTNIDYFLDVPDDEIVRLVRSGERVFNASGLANLQADERAGLLVISETEPLPPKTLVDRAVEARAVEPEAPAPWLEVAADRGLTLPASRDAAATVLAAGLEAWASAATAPLAKAIRRAFSATLLASFVVGDVLRRLRWALADDLPVRSSSTFGTAPWNKLPPLESKRFAANEGLDPVAAALGTMLGLKAPTPLNASSAGLAVDAASRQHRAAVESARGDRETIEAADAALEREMTEIAERSRVTWLEWSADVDRIRRTAYAALDHALANAPPSTPSLVLFALDELRRHGRELPTTGATTPEAALSTVLGSGLPIVLVEPPPEMPATIRMVVSTMSLPRRGRAGLVFGPMPRTVTVTAAQAREIEEDDALIVRAIGDDVNLDLPGLDLPGAKTFSAGPTAADLDALRAEHARALAEQDAQHARALAERERLLAERERLLAEQANPPPPPAPAPRGKHRVI